MPIRHPIPGEALRGLEDPGLGLSTTELETRRRQYGANIIVTDAVSGWRILLGETLRDPMLWFLLGTAVLFAAIGERAEALTLAAALVPLLGMDLYLHQRTQASTAGLASRLAASARVLRDRRERIVAASELVVGDLVLCEAGEYVPADGPILGAEAVQLDESTLSGESLPVRKHAIEPGTRFGPTLIDDCWASAGTRLVSGKLRLRVAATGANTRYGQIVRSVRDEARQRTPLQMSMTRLVGMLLKLAVLACVLVAGVRLIQGHGLVDALLAGVTLAIAALPEEFPVVMTFFLGTGVYRLARRHALVRQAAAVENIGRVSCICSDKTGTLTAGELALSHLDPGPGGDDSSLRRVALLCARDEGGDPLDAAMRALGDEALRGARRLTLFPFTETRRRETALWRETDGMIVAALKGAPETVMAQCGLDETALRAWHARVDALAARGNKVIACAQRRLGNGAPPQREPEQGFEFVGLLGFKDPVRPGVPQALARCARAGIRVVMLTGDHPATASAIAREIGLEGSTCALDASVDASGPAWPADVAVFARAAPEQKLALVRALQHRGEVVAVTGDGVNDVPALQAADVGIAMGIRGARSAREVASIVLLDDEFATIVQAVAEGRQLFANLQRSFAYLLLFHVPLVASAALVPLLGGPLLYLPVHIVWLELLVHPSAMLAFQESAREPMGARVAQARDARFFDAGSAISIAAIGALVALALLALWSLAIGEGLGPTHARSVTIAALVCVGAGVTVVLSRLRTRAAWVMLAAHLGSLAAFTTIAPLAHAMHVEPLHPRDWLLVAGLAMLAMAAVGWLARRLRG